MRTKNRDTDIEIRNADDERRGDGFNELEADWTVDGGRERVMPLGEGSREDATCPTQKCFVCQRHIQKEKNTRERNRTLADDRCIAVGVGQSLPQPM